MSKRVFVSQLDRKERIVFLDVVVVVASLLLSILLILVSVVCVCGGQILFPVNCSAPSQFSPLLLFMRVEIHTHSHAVRFSPWFYCQKIAKRELFFILHRFSFILILLSFSSFFLCHNSSFQSVICYTYLFFLSFFDFLLNKRFFPFIVSYSYSFSFSFVFFSSI